MVLTFADRPLLSVRGVRTRFVGEDVLDGVDIEVSTGEFLCLVGPSGCGKSTLLRIVGHLLPDHDGVVELDGEPAAAAWRRLAYVFQSPRLVPWRTALGNVLLGMELRYDDLSAQERRRRAMEMLRLVGLEHDVDKYPGVLSGGERQRVSIARALAVDPEVVLMDEPLSALDVKTKVRLRDEILRIWSATRKTIVYVTHDLDEALYLADRVVLLSGKPTRVLRTYALDSPRPRDVEADPELRAVGEDLRHIFGDRAELEELVGGDEGG